MTALFIGAFLGLMICALIAAWEDHAKLLEEHEQATVMSILGLYPHEYEWAMQLQPARFGGIEK